MNYMIRSILIAGISMLCLNMFCMQKPRMAIAQSNLDLMKNPYRRSLGNKDANKTLATIAKGDTFVIVDQHRDSDFFIYYKVKTKNNVKGYLFEKDSFTVIDH